MVLLAPWKSTATAASDDGLHSGSTIADPVQLSECGQRELRTTIKGLEVNLPDDGARDIMLLWKQQRVLDVHFSVS